MSVGSYFSSTDGFTAFVYLCTLPSPPLSNREMIVNTNYSENANATQWRNTGAHELGHALGLGHDPFVNLVSASDCPNVSLMYVSTANLSICGISAPTSWDVTAINKIYT